MNLLARSSLVSRGFYRFPVFGHTANHGTRTTSNMNGRRTKSINHATPQLSAMKSDGTMEDIPERELYEYKRHRWVYNESRRLSERYLKFDLQELLKVSVAAMASKGALYCTRVLKCKEGLNNKAFLLTMDNGSEVFVKLPNPCAGPHFYTTASEVATRKFLRDALDIPTPSIIGWCADRNNPVGAEYILEEKAQGQPLWELWTDWDKLTMNERFPIIEQIVEIERKLASIKFPKSGSIYFKEDMPPSSSSLQTDPLLPSRILEQFTLGPLVTKELWRGRREGMDLNRGPYNSPLDFIEAMAKNEIQFIKTHAHPRMNYARSLTERETPSEMLGLLARYLQLASAMLPPQSTTEDTHSPTLWHPDVHLNNVFIDPETKRVVYIIDWQSAAVFPFFSQCGVPAMFKHGGGPASSDISDMTTWPKRPDNYSSLSKDEQDSVDNIIGSECLHKYYLATTYNRNRRHWAALQLQDSVRTQPASIVQGVWEDGDVFFLRQSLIRIINRWEELYPQAPCPTSFSEQEMTLHLHEEEHRAYVAEVLKLFRTWGLPPDGSIEASKFDEMQTKVREMRDTWIAAADDEDERLLAEKIWPFQDTVE